MASGEAWMFLLFSAAWTFGLTGNGGGISAECDGGHCPSTWIGWMLDACRVTR